MSNNLLQFIIVGVFAGISITLGYLRKRDLGDVLAIGSFRTYSEMMSHENAAAQLVYSLKYFVTSCLSALSSGSLTSDFLHRVLPNMTQAITSNIKDKLSDTLTICIGGLLGGFLVLGINSISLWIKPFFNNDLGLILSESVYVMGLYIIPLVYFIHTFEHSKQTALFALAGSLITYLIFNNVMLGLVIGSLITENLVNKHES